MSNVNPEINDTSTSASDVRFEQFPVDAYVRKVHFDTCSDAGDFVRIVVMSNLNTTQHLAFNEYVYNNTALSIDEINSFTMRSGPLDCTEQAIIGFAGTMPQQLCVSQAANFCCGLQCPQSARRRLYQAPDPDDATKRIGVLIEQNTDGRVTLITWYKTRDAKAIFHATPTELKFELVRDASDAPSTDPNNIGPWTWYFTTNLRLSV